MDSPLELPTAPPRAVWDELAELTAGYQRVWREWLEAPATGEPLPGQLLNREQLAEMLVEMLTHLQGHTAAMVETIDDAAVLADELEERQLAQF